MKCQSYLLDIESRMGGQTNRINYYCFAFYLNPFIYIYSKIYMFVQVFRYLDYTFTYYCFIIFLPPINLQFT